MFMLHFMQIVSGRQTWRYDCHLARAGNCKIQVCPQIISINQASLSLPFPKEFRNCIVCSILSATLLSTAVPKDRDKGQPCKLHIFGRYYVKKIWKLTKNVCICLLLQALVLLWWQCEGGCSWHLLANLVACLTGPQTTATIGQQQTSTIWRKKTENFQFYI